MTSPSSLIAPSYVHLLCLRNGFQPLRLAEHGLTTVALKVLGDHWLRRPQRASYDIQRDKSVWIALLFRPLSLVVFHGFKSLIRQTKKNHRNKFIIFQELGEQSPQEYLLKKLQDASFMCNDKSIITQSMEELIQSSTSSFPPEVLDNIWDINCRSTNTLYRVVGECCGCTN